MKELTKTLIFVGVAIVTVVLAIIVNPSDPGEDFQDDSGGAFFADFDDPSKCDAIEIIAIDDVSKEVQRLKVAFTSQGWVIPSHDNHPADAQAKMDKLSANFVGLKKNAVASDTASDHAKLGVQDPEQKTSDTGTRVKFFDSGDKVLADFIIGNEVKGKSNTFYIRKADATRTYTATIDADLSTKFRDWVDQDILKLSRTQIRRLVISRYEMKPKRLDAFRVGRDVAENDVLDFERDDEDEWTLKGLDAANEEINEDALEEVLKTIDLLAIQDVAPRIEELLNLLKQGEFPPTPMDGSCKGDVLGVAGKGYFQSLQRRYLLGQAGDFHITHENGLQYTLHLGEVESRQEKDEDGKDVSKEYYNLMVTVKFDPTVNPAPQIPEKPDGFVEKDKRAEASLTTEQDEEFKKYDKALKDYERDQKSWKTDSDNAKKKAEELTERYGGWFYLIGAEDLKNMTKTRADLVKVKPNYSAEGYTELEDGLWYKDEIVGEGAEVVEGDKVHARYRGTFEDGKEFDKNEEPEEPFEFTAGPAGAVIDGWKRGVIGMKIGGKRKLIIAPDLAYGSSGKGDIPPDTTLWFDLEVVGIEGK